MRKIREWFKRKIWREPTKEDIAAFFERWAARIDIKQCFDDLQRQAEYENLFEPVLLPDGTLPESERMSRGRDFEEAYKEIFGRSMEEDAIIQEALKLYEEDE